ncbi:protein SSX3-like isoform X1 [Symphalangus syndactylus]|uniref:protein SSX3-like isoform X1 n=1 Tax=Symphalangus syndactylus TaxID=9590 RepID=UPI0024415AB0|nr:protein SSX3-like isoform X1 [Symphalangus syndactylus]
MNGDDAFARRPMVGAQMPEKIQKAFDDIAIYFSKEEWEKMKASEKIIYVYMKRKYEAMTKLGFKATLPSFMRHKRAIDLQGNDFDNDHNRGHQVERPQMTSGTLQGIFPKITPEKPAEEGSDSKGVSEASAPQNHGKQLCPPGNPSTSQKIHETSGNREAQEKEERRGTAHRWSSQNTHNIGRLSLSTSVGAVHGTPKTITHNRDPKGGNMPGPTDCVRESRW